MQFSMVPFIVNPANLGKNDPLPSGDIEFIEQGNSREREVCRFVARTSEDFMGNGLISAPEKDAIISEAGELIYSHKKIKLSEMRRYVC